MYMHSYFRHWTFQVFFNVHKLYLIRPIVFLDWDGVEIEKISWFTNVLTFTLCKHLLSQNLQEMHSLMSQAWPLQEPRVLCSLFTVEMLWQNCSRQIEKKLQLQLNCNSEPDNYNSGERLKCCESCNIL